MVQRLREKLNLEEECDYHLAISLPYIASYLRYGTIGCSCSMVPVIRTLIGFRNIDMGRASFCTLVSTVLSGTSLVTIHQAQYPSKELLF